MLAGVGLALDRHGRMRVIGVVATRLPMTMSMSMSMPRIIWPTGGVLVRRHRIVGAKGREVLGLTPFLPKAAAKPRGAPPAFDCRRAPGVRPSPPAPIARPRARRLSPTPRTPDPRSCRPTRSPPRRPPRTRAGRPSPEPRQDSRLPAHPITGQYIRTRLEAAAALRAGSPVQRRSPAGAGYRSSAPAHPRSGSHRAVAGGR